MTIPLKGDRGAFDVTNYPTLHASDLLAAAPRVHVPVPGAAGTVPVSDGSKWVATAPDAGDSVYTPGTLTDWDSDADPGDVDDALDQLAARTDDLEDVQVNSNEPTGFINRTSSTLTFSAVTLKVSLAVVSGSYSFYSGGNLFTKTTTQEKAIADTAGMHYVYFDTAGVMQEAVLPWDIASAIVPVACVYWDGAAGILMDERHGIQMDGRTHEYLHETRGPAFAFGLAGTFAADGSTITIGAGEWYDDDIEHEPDEETTCRVFWLDGTTWQWTAAQAPYHYAVQYNNAGALANVDANKYSTSWVFHTNHTTTPVAVIMGQAQYNTQAQAEAAGLPNLSTLPAAEMLLLYKVVWQRNGAVIAWKSTTDYRRVSGGSVANYVATDHGALSGLADNDHPQYFLIADTQTTNYIYAGPASGAAAAPTFRALVSNDIPSLDHGAKLTGLADDDHTHYLLATGSRTGASAGAQTFTNGIIGPSWKPAANSTTALQMQNAAGTAVLNVDTTNSRVGIGTTAPATILHSLLSDAETEAVSNAVTLGHDTSGTAAAGFGTRLLWQLESSTTAAQDAATLDVLWSDATHATRTSMVRLRTVVNGVSTLLLHNYRAASSSGNNIFLGVNAGNITMSPGGGAATLASYNTGVGSGTLTSLTTGYSNLAIGSGSLGANTTGYGNVAVGVNALATNITGNESIAIGSNALILSTASGNAAIGANALTSNTTGNSNVAIGNGALLFNVDGNGNMAIGADALHTNASGYYCVAIGAGALYSSTGWFNIGIGTNAGNSITSGGANTAIGYSALAATGAQGYSIGIGMQAGQYETAGYKLFIDTIDRTNEAGGRTKSLIYGVFDATVANQEITFNVGKHGFYGQAAVAKPTGVAVTAAAIHAALVTLNLIAA